MRLWELCQYDTNISLSRLPSLWGINKCEYNEVETPTRCTNTTGPKSDACCHVVQRFRRSGLLSIRHNGREHKENIKHTAFGSDSGSSRRSPLTRLFLQVLPEDVVNSQEYPSISTVVNTRSSMSLLRILPTAGGNKNVLRVARLRTVSMHDSQSRLHS